MARPPVLRIVVAERSGECSRMFARSLGSFAEVWAAGNWDALLLHMELTRPHLLVLDAAIREDWPTLLRALPPLRVADPELRIVIIARRATAAAAVQAVRMGAHGVLSRPTSVSQVLAAADLRMSGGEVTPKGTLTLDAAIWEYINTVIDETGSLSTAARSLCLDRRSLRRMLARYRPIPPDH